MNVGDSTCRAILGRRLLHLCIYMLAQEEGRTVEEYWEEHGEAGVDHARRYIKRIRKLLA